MEENNKSLARIFKQMAIQYEILGSENRFRSRAYQKAAVTLLDLGEDISRYMKDGELQKISGIGEGIAKKVLEYLKTGEIKKHEFLQHKVPQDFLELVEVRGLGPETLRKFHTELGIKSKGDLVRALNDGRIENMEGFGPKKVANIKAALEQKAAAEKRIGLWKALELGQMLLEKLQELPEVCKVELAGSARRRKETVGDIDMLVAADKKDWSKIINYFTTLREVESVISKGETKASVVIENFKRQADLRMVEETSWGAALLYFTGAKEHNIHLRNIALDQGNKLSEYGLFDAKTGLQLAGKTEQEVYKALGMAWLPPEMRENRGEIELAKRGEIPALVTVEDIRGDMHMHSNWSDGKHSLEEIVQFIKENYAYEYIVVTDHSKSTRIAGGMDEKGFENQLKAIGDVNRQLGGEFLKAGVEVDILADGSLDLSDELLGQLDWVVASVHALFKQDNTERLIKACESPYVHVLGHPTGRLIGSREGYPLDMEEVIKAARATGTALEINAQPKRIDLNDYWARRARENGVPLVISTDSHAFGNYEFLKLGVYVARRAWCMAEQILNTYSWEKIKQFKQKKVRLLEKRNK